MNTTTKPRNNKQTKSLDFIETTNIKNKLNIHGKIKLPKANCLSSANQNQDNYWHSGMWYRVKYMNKKEEGFYTGEIPCKIDYTK